MTSKCGENKRDSPARSRCITFSCCHHTFFSNMWSTTSLPQWQQTESYWLIFILLSKIIWAQSFKRADIAIQRINRCTADKDKPNILRYSLLSDLSSGWRYPLLQQQGPGNELILHLSKKKILRFLTESDSKLESPRDLLTYWLFLRFEQLACFYHEFSSLIGCSDYLSFPLNNNELNRI